MARGRGKGAPYNRKIAGRTRSGTGYDVGAIVPMAVERRAGVLVGLSQPVARGLSADQPQ